MAQQQKPDTAREIDQTEGGMVMPGIYENHDGQVAGRPDTFAQDGFYHEQAQIVPPFPDMADGSYPTYYQVPWTYFGDFQWRQEELTDFVRTPGNEFSGEKGHHQYAHQHPVDSDWRQWGVLPFLGAMLGGYGYGYPFGYGGYGGFGYPGYGYGYPGYGYGSPYPYVF